MLHTYFSCLVFVSLTFLLFVFENESHQFCFLNTTVSQSNVSWCSFTSVFQLDDFCLCGACNKRKFMSRRISYASNGSFNPYIITNKEAHVVNGNPTRTTNGSKNSNGSDNNLTDSNSLLGVTQNSLSCQNVSIPIVQQHFMNHCLEFPGKFSCAVDCFMELSNYIFLVAIEQVERNEFFEILYRACVQLDSVEDPLNQSQFPSVREPVWVWLRQHCPSFTDMSANAVFSDIFKINTVGELTLGLRSLFVIQHSNHSLCSECNQQITSNSAVFVLYITPNHYTLDRVNGFEGLISEAILPNVNRIFCSYCQTYSGSIALLRHSVALPTFLLVELSSNCINRTFFPECMDVLGVAYTLKGIVRCASRHFTVAINRGSEWVYINDMCHSVQHFASVQELLCTYNGWFFAVFQKLQSVADELHEMSSRKVSTKHSSGVVVGGHVENARNSYGVEGHQSPTNKLPFQVSRKRKKNPIDNNYSEHKEKRKKYMKEYRARKKNASVGQKISTCIDNECTDLQFNPSQFDCNTSQKLHEKELAKQNMKKFHESMKLKIFMCKICHEAWPLHFKSKKENKTYICSRCVRDKNGVKKFSSENRMIPSPVPEQLQDLSQIEEMLIARVFPIISVYTKPGGQRAYRGHCINFSQELKQLAYTLPRYPKDLPVIVVTVNGRDNVSKDLVVRRDKVSAALHWLIKHNPAYKDVEIDYDCLARLPLQDVPADLSKVNSVEDKTEEIDPDRGPLDIEDLPNNQETELSSMLLSPVKCKQQKELIKDEILQKNKIRWPERNRKAVNEFKMKFLATMAFPCLFPDGKGDPTNFEIKRDATLGEKIKHLIKFGEKKDGKWHYRFAAHPRFGYWAFNMLQRHRLLSQGSIFLQQNPRESHISVDELKEMLSSNNYSSIMAKLMHYAKNVTGSDAYWHKAKDDLRATISQVGPPTIFFTLSCAEYHWPEFHNLFDEKNVHEMSPCERQLHVWQNLHILDWLFTERTDHFVKYWLYNSLGASWHWYRYEYAVQRGSIHCHGVAKLNSDPGICELTEVAQRGFLAAKLKAENKELSKQQVENIDADIVDGRDAERRVCQYVDFLLSTWNPCSPDEGWSKPNIHPCQSSYLSLKTKDMDKDYVDLLNSVERHTTCSSKYCLRKNDKSELCCRFKFPFDTCSKTRLEFENVNSKSGEIKYKATLVTKRNDSRLNRHQPLQLQGWRGNCDIQIVIDYYACLQYLVKYTSKAEKMSSVVKTAFTNVVTKLNENADVHSTFKQIMLKTVGNRDYSIQEVMHHLLSLKSISSSFEVVKASLDGSRRINMKSSRQSITEPSTLDIYSQRKRYISLDPNIMNLNFWKFFSMFTLKGSKLVKRAREVIVKTYPNYPSSPTSEHYALFCKYQLIKYRPWSETPSAAWDNLEENYETFITCWKQFLLCENSKNLVPDWESKMQDAKAYLKPEEENETIDNDEEKEEWMLMAELNFKVEDEMSESLSIPDEYWNEQRENYTRQQIAEMPSWISVMKRNANFAYHASTRVIDIATLNELQYIAYKIVNDHFMSINQRPLFFLVKGIAGSGKSYLIDTLRNLLQTNCRILAYTGKAAFNVKGITLHSFLKLPIGNKRNNDLNGIALQQLQDNLNGVNYLMIDEYSLVGQNLLGWIDSRCRQATGKANEPFGGLSLIFFGDIAQLPPVLDKPLYHSAPQTDKQVNGFLMYQQFQTVITLTANERVKGCSDEQLNFRVLLTRARNGNLTLDDWHTLLSRTPDRAKNITEFEKYAVKLCYYQKDVVRLNTEKLKNLGQPIVVIKARHYNGAQKLHSDEFRGLEPVLYSSKDSRVMLTMNLWTEVGLCNGALGKVVHFIYAEGQHPPCLPICVIVQFDDTYIGPSISDQLPRCVPICPITQVSYSSGIGAERQQLPLRLAWAMTIHKCQGLTLEKAWIDLGQSENVTGITYVGLSRVKKLSDLIVEPMSFERLQATKNSKNLRYRINEEKRLDNLSERTLAKIYDIRNSNKK